MLFLGAPAGAENSDPDFYRQQCSQGVTIYCIAIGMEEQKAGHLEKALEHFRSACQNHPQHGHLGACTPYLALALQLEKLEEAASGLESQCDSGDDRTCFYLAKEYLKITAYSRADRHLERLCRTRFQPPDPEDYGPCFHWGKSLQNRGELEQAAEVFERDCQRDPIQAAPSCRHHEALLVQIKQERSTRSQGIEPFQPVEAVLGLLVLFPFFSFGLWKMGRSRTLQVVRLPLPLLTLMGWGVWEVWGGRLAASRDGLFFIVPSVMLVFFLAALAHRELQASERIIQD